MIIWEIIDANQALFSLTLCSIGIERLWAWFPSNLFLKIILYFCRHRPILRVLEAKPTIEANVCSISSGNNGLINCLLCKPRTASLFDEKYERRAVCVPVEGHV